MRKQRIYLETTLFNHYFDEDRGFAHESTIALFKEIATGKQKIWPWHKERRIIARAEKLPRKNTASKLLKTQKNKLILKAIAKGLLKTSPRGTHHAFLRQRCGGGSCHCNLALILKRRSGCSSPPPSNTPTKWSRTLSGWTGAARIYQNWLPRLIYWLPSRGHIRIYLTDNGY